MESESTAVEPEIAPMRAEATTLPDTARTVAIVDEPTFQAAGAILLRIKTLRTTLAQLFTPHISRAFKAHRALLDDRRRLDAPLADAEDVLKRRLAAFTLEEETRRTLEARRTAAEAQEARTAQIWAEVEELDAAGYHGEVTDLVNELVSTPVPVVLAPAPPVKAEGLHTRAVWRYEVIDEAQVPREYLMIDHAKLGSVVRALKSAAQIPGVRTWVERTIAATGR